VQIRVRVRVSSSVRVAVRFGSLSSLSFADMVRHGPMLFEACFYFEQ